LFWKTTAVVSAKEGHKVCRPAPPDSRRWEALGNAINVDVVCNIAKSLVMPIMD